MILVVAVVVVVVVVVIVGLCYPEKVPVQPRIKPLPVSELQFPPQYQFNESP